MVVALSIGVPALFILGVIMHLLSAVHGKRKNIAAAKERKADLEWREEYAFPIERAVRATLRTKEPIKATIDRGLPGAGGPGPIGTVTLPPSWPGNEADKRTLTEIFRDRLGNALVTAQFNLQGSAPHVYLSVPAQTPTSVPWELMMERADPLRPYLGESALGSVYWDLGGDSPHAAIIGGSGSGKSELMAWVVAQFLRGGAGLVVLDPKYSSHKWLLAEGARHGRGGVAYYTEPAQVHDTVLWLDEELRRRGRLSQVGQMNEPPIAVLLEERNSMQSLLRAYWREIKVTGDPMMSPALSALDRLGAQGRSLKIYLILGAQEAGKVDIGSRSNFGAFALAGRLPANAWRLAEGPGTKKPTISNRPGRFGWRVGDSRTIFQSAFADVSEDDPAKRAPEVTKAMRDRLWDFASKHGIFDVEAYMQLTNTPSFPSSQGYATENATNEMMTLREFAAEHGVDVEWLRNQRTNRGDEFPRPALDSEGRVRVGPANARYFSERELADFVSVYGEEN